VKVTRGPLPRRPVPPPAALGDAFLVALMDLADQPARSLALDAFTGIGPGSEDTRESARVILRAAKRLNWERWRAMATLAEHAGVKI